MTNSFSNLIQQFKDLMSELHKQFASLNSDLQKFLPSNNAELVETIAAFKFQTDYTNSTDNLLKTVPSGATATFANLTTAINLVQLYFQGIQPLDSVLTNLGELLESLDPPPASLTDIKTKISAILSDRTKLQKTLNRVLQEFDSDISNLTLQSLLQRSSVILSALNQLSNQSVTLNVLSPLIDDLTDHLKKAQDFFQSSSRRGEDLTGNEPNEIKQLVLNWGEALRQIEELEKADSIKQALSNGTKGRAAIAQSILLHDLLEATYDTLTALVRSGDLESAGIL